MFTLLGTGWKCKFAGSPDTRGLRDSGVTPRCAVAGAQVMPKHAQLREEPISVTGTGEKPSRKNGLGKPSRIRTPGIHFIFFYEINWN